MLGSFVVAAAIIGAGIYFMRQTVADRDRLRTIEETESDCANKGPAATEIVLKKDSMQGAHIQVTGTVIHFNRRLKQCLVEISTFEHQDAPVYVKTMVNVGTGSLMLWSLATDDRGTLRNCFNAQGQQLDCTEVDRQWRTLMFE
jgi:hypothetical protein